MISDEICRDTFCYDVLNDKAPFSKGILSNGARVYQNVFTLNDMLSESDKSLLEDYAPKLFNTYSELTNLHNAMLEWATLVHNYRNTNYEKSIIHGMQGKQKIPRYEKKSLEEKQKVFKNRIKDILKLMSTNFSTNENIKELTDILKQAHETPERYFNSKPKYKITKQPIRDYLTSLELEGKSKKIIEFLKDLN